MSALNGEIIICGQSVGGDIQLRMFGDEFYNRCETVEGYTVVYDTDAGRYCYAQLAAGRFVSTGVWVGKPIPTGVPKHLKEAADVRAQRFGARYDQLRPREPASGSNATRTLGPDNGLLDGRKLFAGAVRGLTVIIDFDDVRTNITPAQVDAMMNGDNYTANGNFCSVKEYFDTVSNGKLNYTNRVVGPVQLTQRRSHYIDNLLVEEALDLVVNDLGVDLAEFDSQGAGIVDALNLLYAGESQYSGDLWPHNSVQQIQYGTTRTHYYQVTGLGSQPVDLRIGTICHENAHQLFRFPDMYDYGKRDNDFKESQGIGRFCLMGSGNHLNGRRTPAPVCSYLRELAGWPDETVILNGTTNHDLMHGDYSKIYKFETDTPNEYFMVENRSKLALDSHLPDGGLAILHCDRNGSNEWQDGTRLRHYQCALLQADGHLDLENDLNSGDAGDLFTSVSGVAASSDTTPSTRRWDGADSGLVIADVSGAGERMAFRVGESQDETIARAETFPNRIIPDNSQIEDVLSIAESGTLAAIAVNVNIIHSWIGDLRVALVAPDGTTCMLHDRAGRENDDIDQTFTSTDTNSLRQLEGKPIQGDWKLRVSDHESADVGRLAEWRLEIEYAPTGSRAEGQAAPNVTIPDSNSVGVSSSIALQGAGNVWSLRVAVDIEHTYIGDLEVDVISPGGQVARLHDHEGRNADNIQRTYDAASFPALTAMRGQPVAGDWRLVVRDRAPLDEGTLKSWSITIDA
ncbi:MAG: M6 family metalloprotease domain-containing protein [Planctomycetota bacterium]|nr:M6 family metalloprotease domain-containing protein [Planctomycetota bacterium]